MTTKLTIVQSYVPTYRVSFFEGLQQKLAEQDVECMVAAGSPLATQARRGDSVNRDWILPIERKAVTLRGRTLKLAINPIPWNDADAVIMGLEGSSMPVFKALADSRKSGLRLGLWGHAKPYVSPGNRIDLALEKVQMKYADHIFAYTPGGTQYVEECGVDPQKITTVMNTVDTSEVVEDLRTISNGQAWAYAEKVGYLPDRTVCFIGGLDSSKRIDFLAEALDHLWKIDPTIKLLVGGKGQDEYLLESAYRRGQALPMGYLAGHTKALALKTTRAICMPGRIGLVAVDGLLAGLPVLTTAWPYHAPEAEYLVEGESRFTAPNEPVAYANLVQKFVDLPRIERQFSYPSLDSMIENYAGGVMRMLNH